MVARDIMWLSLSLEWRVAESRRLPGIWHAKMGIDFKRACRTLKSVFLKISTGGVLTWGKGKEVLRATHTHTHTHTCSVTRRTLTPRCARALSTLARVRGLTA